MSDNRLELIDQNNEGDVRFVFETRRHPEIVPCLFGKPPESLEQHKAWLRANVPEKRLLFLLKVDGIPVGYCQAYDFGGETVEVGFVVHPEHQDKGHGGRMVDMLLDELKARMPEKRVVLEVRADNERAIGLYKWHGFVEKSIHMEKVEMERP